MSARRLRRAVAAVLTFALSAAASANAADAPNGFRATGTLVVQANVSGSPINVGGNVALYARGDLYRLDVLSLAFPGTDPTASALAGALLAPGGATVIYNGATGSVSAYSTGNHVYYEDPGKLASATPAPVAAPAGNARASGPLATLAAVARQLHDVQQAAIALTGHSTTNGHPTDDLDVTIKRQRPGKPVEDYHAQVALADDLDGFPLRIALTSKPATPQDFGGSFRLDLTAVARDAASDELFAIPPGLTRVSSLGEVIQARH